MSSFRIGWRPRFAAVLAAATLASVLALAPSAQAATYKPGCDEDRLIAAILDANTTVTGLTDVIDLKKGCTYEFDSPYLATPNALPAITNDNGVGTDLIINGNGAKLVRDDDDDTPAFRLLQIRNHATVVLNDLTVKGGFIKETTGGVGAAGILVGQTGDGAATLVGNKLKVIDNEVLIVGGGPTTAALGGGIFIFGDLTLNGSTVADNEATAIGLAAAQVFGGGIAGTESTKNLTLNRTAIKANEAHSFGLGSTQSQGGGVRWHNGGTVTIDRSSVTKNVAQSRSATSATAQGGGLSLTMNAVQTITRSTISGNKAVAEDAKAQGGGLYLFMLPGATTTIADSEIDNNRAHAVGDGSLAQGGGIFQYGGTLLVDPVGGTSTEISGNRATATGFSASQGGGYAVVAGTVSLGASGTFNFTEFEDNLASAPQGMAMGGGLYLGSAATVTMNEADVSDNEAEGSVLARGGGIFTETCTALILDPFTEVEDNEPDDIFQAGDCPILSF